MLVIPPPIVTLVGATELELAEYASILSGTEPFMMMINDDFNRKMW